MAPQEPVKLPSGLRICPTCGEARGWSGYSKSWCLCQGALVCKGCNIWRIQLVAGYYDWHLGTWWHVSSFGYLGECRVCRGIADPPGNAPEPS